VTNTVVVAGASGLVGHAAAQHFASLPGWQVIGLARRSPADIAGATMLSVDLSDRRACENVVSRLTGVTHLVFAALYEVPGLSAGWFDPTAIDRNAQMLRNVIEPLENVAVNLEHVSLLQGTKAYGIHHPSIGYAGASNPLREREPRRDHPNFYFVQEDYLRERQQAASWGLTIFRPTVVYGDAPGNHMNPIPVLGAYAALLRDEGSPLAFPGGPRSRVLREAVDVELLAHALAWAATSPAARDSTFNVTNGDVFLWHNVWAVIAAEMGMAVGEDSPLSLLTELPRRAGQWAAMVERENLRAPSEIMEFVGHNSLVYTDRLLNDIGRPATPTLHSTIAIRQAGFAECMDTEDLFAKWMRRLQDNHVLPPGPAR
jgi:nucleoside-diphosphate-sugar epimerase